LAGALCSAAAAELPLTRVVLSSAGLAQFTHSGPVSAGSTVELAVRLDQVDDILKSMTVFDREGAIGAVSLPGKTPLAELFRDLPFGPDALNSRTALLNALIGSEVEIAGQVAAKGRVFHVEDEDVALPNNGGTTTRHRLTLMTDKGLVQAVLEEVTALRFTDPRAQAQVERALAGLAENRAKERRTLSIGFLGQGARNVSVSYVVAAPVWKAAYRLVLPKEGAKARLQGWAVLENLTGGDWTNVDLVLVSGNPVALRQPLYTAFFAERPEVPVATAARLLPRSDDADQPVLRLPALAQAPARKATVAPAPPQMAQTQRAFAPRAPGAAPETATAQDVLAAVANAAEADDASTQLLYRFPAKISLATGHTMMLPFLDRELTVTRTWLYQPETSARRPFAAVRLPNDGDAGLPPGILTAFETSVEGPVNFVGDAQLPLLPKGSFKFITFALDGKTDIRREDKGVRSTTLGKAVNGELDADDTLAPIDRLRGHAAARRGSRDRGRRGPRGWMEAVPGEQGCGGDSDPVPLQNRRAERKDDQGGSRARADRPPDRATRRSRRRGILARIRGLDNESAALKEAVAKLAALVTEINKAKSQRAQLDAERKRIAEDQDRIRRNLQSVGAGSDLGRRYLDTLKSQEDRLADITRSDAALEDGLAAKRKSAEEVARQLAL
ncbi:MAG: DUF4139 domain-containing protein, partial [Rhodoplanes sp.]